MSQKLLLTGFKGVEEMSQSNEHFIRSYDDDSDEEYFLEIDVQYFKNLNNLHNN